MLSKSSFSFLKYREIYISFIAGACSALGFAPFYLLIATLLGFAVFFVKFQEAPNLKQALTITFVFSFAFHLVSLYWLAFPLLVTPDKHAFLIPFALSAGPSYLSLFWLIPAALAKKYIPKQAIWGNVCALCAALSVVMYFYGHYCPGFPWVYVGYIWSCSDISFQLLSLMGIHGLNLLTIFVSFTLGAAYIFSKEHDSRSALISVIVVVGIMLSSVMFGFFRLQSFPSQYTKHKARIIQCSISQRQKMNKSEAITNLQKHVQLSKHKSHIDFVIWPEACIPYLYRSDSINLNTILKSHLHQGEYLISGAVREDINSGKIYNSVIVLDSNGNNTNCYDKVRLVPFGEYMPFRKYIPFQSLAAEIEDFDVGNSNHPIKINGLNIAFAICYEAVFPQDFIPKGDSVDVIVNVTNDAWFGYTNQPFQHLQIVRARSIENGIPLIRATNFGVSAVYDALGREIGHISFDQAGHLDFYIPKKIPSTPYGKFGDSLFFIFILINIIGTIATRQMKLHR